MRSPSLTAVLLAAAVAVEAGAPSVPKAPSPPSDELVAAACGQGLLIRSDDADKKGGDGGAAFADETDRDYPDLFGGGDEAPAGDAAPSNDPGAKPADGSKAPAKPAPKPRSKTRLLKPGAKNAERCPEEFRDFYARHGDHVRALPAPNIDRAQMEGKIDRVFELSSGSAKSARLAALTGDDLRLRRATVDKLFDGVTTLGDADFAKVDQNRHALAAIRPADLLRRAKLADADADGGSLFGTATVPPKDPNPLAGVVGTNREPVPTNPGSGISDAQRRRWSPDGTVPYHMPPVGSYEPSGQTRPHADSWYNRFVPDRVQDAITGAGSWTADKIWGGGDPRVNSMMPGDNHEPPRWRRVRFGNYGTESMVKGLLATFEDMGRMNAPTILLGDISQRGGGSFRGHLSHKIGKDADIFFVVDKHGRFDVPWNLMLAACAVKNMNVTRIFVDTPLKNLMTRYLNENPQLPADQRAMMSRALSKMQYWPGHDTHFHVRIDY